MADHLASVKADARDRARRTLFQGLTVDILVALGISVLSWVTSTSDEDFASKDAWILLGILVAKSVIQAGAAWLMRLKIDPQTSEIVVSDDTK